jgi:mannose-6-phosphate isomerase
LEQCLHRLPVQAGDAVFIPAGSVHAILEGIVLAEIQQNSDTTYRVYDWNRLGTDSKPRSLHIDKALEVINFQQVEPKTVQPQLLEETATLHRELLTSCPYFNVERITFRKAGSCFKGHTDGKTFEIWGILSGQGQVAWSGTPVHLPAIQFVLLPAALGDFEIRATEPAVCLRAFVPA